MTDNEIVKALECCMDEMGCLKGCPCFNPKAKGSHCSVSKKLELEKLTLDLINRLQEEIIVKKKLLDKAEAKFEAFEMDKKQLESDIINANQNFDHIKELWEVEKGKVEKAKQKVIDIGRALKTAKAEAYKEFAKFLIDKSQNSTISISDLPDYVAEMEGGASEVED